MAQIQLDAPLKIIVISWLSMKMKTKKAAAKRFKLTATGKIRHKPVGMRHNLGNKSAKSKLAKRRLQDAFEGNRYNIDRCLPYGI